MKVEDKTVKKLWVDGKSFEDIMGFNKSVAILNLHEDILCLKEAELDKHKPLSLDEIDAVFPEPVMGVIDEFSNVRINTQWVYAFARAIEKEHGII